MSAETLIHETLARAAGALLSLAFSITPGLGARYAVRTDSFLRFYIRLWLPSRMRFRIRFIHEKHLRSEQLIWVRLADEMHAGFHPVWVHCLEIS
jgi:hypothetical protein